MSEAEEPATGRTAPTEDQDRPTEDEDREPRGDALTVDEIEKHYGGITAVDHASFTVESGTLTGLIGPNGAGKSTTFDLITGFEKPDGGEVYFGDERITGMEPYEIADEGLVRTFQIARELGEMTVMENLMLAPKGQIGEALWRSVTPGARGAVMDQETEMLERAWDMLEFFEIDHLWDEYAENLSGGQRKLLEMSRALMTDPEMVLLDEPLAGVNPTLEKKLLERIHQLRGEDYTFLLVEHDMDVIMEHCDRIIVMHQGQVLAEGSAADIQENEQVVDAYLGEDV